MFKKVINVLTILRNIYLVSRSGFFDKAYYLKQNPDVKKAKVNPVIHYLSHGGFEGRNPGPNFHSDFYLSKYTDVNKSGLNPLLHFILYGKKEGRKTIAYTGFINAVSKDAYLLQKQGDFRKFIKSGSKIIIPGKQPILSIILIFYNSVELSYACLQSIQQYVNIPYEIIIVDNNSTDKTQLLLDRIEGAIIIRNKENLHFIKGCNQAFQYVKGDYILFLNNDAVLLEGTIKAAYNSIAKENNCGAVGGKIILADGKLQEAGSIIWNDGSCLGYGRDELPDLPEYNFNRVVDYCSGTFLMTRTELFRKHRGFDSLLEPAYYEETDYCLWLQEQGFIVIYNPKAIIRHYEFGSGIRKNAIILQKKNQKKLLEKHKEQLKKHFQPDTNRLLYARFAASQGAQKNLLYIDDRIPHIDLGAGFPRSNTIVRCILELGYKITIFPLNFTREDWNSAYRDIDPFIEVAMGYGITDFRKFIHSRKHYYDFIWISRPHNMKALKNDICTYRKESKIIYDAEAIFIEREINKMLLKGETLNENKIKSELQKELSLAKIADIVTAVSVTDAEKFIGYGLSNVKVLGHALLIKDTTAQFEERKGLLFVGNLDYENSPNVDSVLWFVKKILPIIREKLPDIELNIVGSCHAKSINSLKIEGIQIHGRIEDLAAFYGTSRVFIAPTRYAAGMPYKIHEAASFGLPVVATDLLAKQLGWTHKAQLISANPEKNDFAEKVIELYQNRELWESIKKNALQVLKKDMSYSDYKQNVSDILTSVLIH